MTPNKRSDLLPLCDVIERRLKDADQLGCDTHEADEALVQIREALSRTPIGSDLVERVAEAMIEPLGYFGKTMVDAETIWVGNNIDTEETGSLAFLCRSLARAAIKAASGQ